MVVANIIQDDISGITHVFILKGNVINEKLITSRTKSYICKKEFSIIKFNIKSKAKIDPSNLMAKTEVPGGNYVEI